MSEHIVHFTNGAKFNPFPKLCEAVNAIVENDLSFENLQPRINSETGFCELAVVSDVSSKSDISATVTLEHTVIATLEGYSEEELTNEVIPFVGHLVEAALGVISSDFLPTIKTNGFYVNNRLLMEGTVSELYDYMATNGSGYSLLKVGDVYTLGNNFIFAIDANTIDLLDNVADDLNELAFNSSADIEFNGMISTVRTSSPGEGAVATLAKYLKTSPSALLVGPYTWIYQGPSVIPDEEFPQTSFAPELNLVKVQFNISNQTSLSAMEGASVNSPTITYFDASCDMTNVKYLNDVALSKIYTA